MTSHEIEISQKAITVLSDQGSGRSFVVVFDDHRYLELAHSVASAIAGRARTIVIESASVTGNSWRSLAAEFEAVLRAAKIRQASFVGIGAGATLVQNLLLDTPKVVRTLVIVDASLRAHPSRWERIVDTIEARLPFGLPLRLGSVSFNVRAFAHRLRCPMLVVSSQQATRFIRRELRDLARVAPTAWYVQLNQAGKEREAAELGELVLQFHDTAAKCPQKNIQEAV